MNNEFEYFRKNYKKYDSKEMQLKYEADELAILEETCKTKIKNEQKPKDYREKKRVDKKRTKEIKELQGKKHIPRFFSHYVIVKDENENEYVQYRYRPTAKKIFKKQANKVVRQNKHDNIKQYKKCFDRNSWFY